MTGSRARSARAPWPFSRRLVDFHGEMDFKVAGTKKGITAIQMDIKNDGLSHAIIKEALDITKDARYALGNLAGLGVGGGDVDSAVVLNVDLRA